MAKVKTHGEEHWVRCLCFSTDLLIFTFSLHAATLSVTAFLEPGDLPGLLRDRLLCIALFGGVCIAVGAYKSYRLTDRFDAIYFMLLALGVALVAQLLLALLVMRDSHVIARRELILGPAIAAPLLITWRFFAAGFLATHFQSLHRFYFVIGNPREAKRIATVINEDASSHARARNTTLAAVKRKYAHRDDRKQGDPPPTPEEAIITHTGKQHGKLTEAIEVCDACFQRTFLYPSQHDAIIFQHHNLHAVAGIPLIQVAGQQRASSYPYVKRAIDFMCATAGLLCALPVLIVTALAIKLTSPGPVLFLQERVGRGGRPFKISKFRSMVTNAKGDDAPVRAPCDDPRVTRVGRIIRKYKIDEIPQLLNVLRGDMSLVGPRPLWEDFFDKDPGATLWRKRLAVRPGVTSLAHVLSSSHFTPADVLRYDLMYIKNLSFLTDLRILFGTVRIVLSGKGGQ